MAERTSSMGSKARLSKILSQERLTGTDREIAMVHEVNRQSAVKEILVHVFFMSKFNIVGDTVTIEKAGSQYIRASGNDEAAHCAPGQILFGTAIQNLLIASDDLQLTVENLFGKTDTMDVKFNKADRRAEENGLLDAFCNACNFVARAAKTARFNRAEAFYPHIDAAFDLYKMGGQQAFRQAIARQRVLMRSSSAVPIASRREWIFILEIYTAKLASSLNTLETVLGLFPEDLWREYRAIV